MSAPSFLADENVAAPLVAAMRDAGWDVVSVMEMEPGIGDEVVLTRAYAETRILLTSDKDFGELVFRLRKPVHGILMLRLPVGPWPAHWARLKAVLGLHADRLHGAFTVVGQDKVRFRPLAPQDAA